MAVASRISIGFLILLAFSACKKDQLELGIKFQLQYHGAPLVMLQDYQYPDGKKVQFTRVSFFLSDLTARSADQSILIREVDFVNPTSAHQDAASAEKGFSYYRNDVELSTIDELTFNIGLRSDQNKTVPADYESGDPLARPGEYWIAWDSYIFAKIEGWVDLDGDDQVETGIALHMGSDQVFRSKSLVIDGPANDLVITLDLYDVFNRDKTYDIAANPQLHSLSQLPAAEELADNIMHAFKMK